MDRIAVINATTVMSDADVLTMVKAIEVQMDKHFYPLWGIPANLHFVPRGSRPPRGLWYLAMLDDADQAGVLGYHDITNDGQPLGKVFAKTDMLYGYSISVTLSHEVLEMLADPDVNLLVQDGSRANRFWAYEACDAVEADELGYDINGVRVSNFVTPDYFETFRTSGRFDYLGQLAGPVPRLTPGGYMAYVENGVWNQVFAQSQVSGERTALHRARYRSRPGVGGRRYRRMLGREHWIPSVVETE